MNKYIVYIKEFHEWNELEINFIETKLKWNEDQTVVEHILDFLYNNEINISNIWYKTINEKAKKWNKKLQQIKVKDNEKEWIDYETILDFENWFKFFHL